MYIYICVCVYVCMLYIMMQQYRNLAHVWAPVARDALREQVRSLSIISLSLYIYMHIYRKREMMQQYQNLAHVWAPVARDALREQVRSPPTLSLLPSRATLFNFYSHELRFLTNNCSTANHCACLGARRGRCAEGAGKELYRLLSLSCYI